MRKQFMSEGRIFNFSAGPAVLPEEVLRQAQEDIWNIAGSGIGILEHSHRGKVFDAIIDETEANCRKLANISDDYHVLFLQGGATMQFGMIPMNFMQGKTADYIHTGVWTKKAMEEARLFGTVNMAYDGTASKFAYIPEESEIVYNDDAEYVFYCSNNTIYGTEWKRIPAATKPLICDTSSDMFSRPIDVSKHALIFAGAQKNLGPAGCTLIILHKAFMEKARTGLPVMLDYRKQAAEKSMLNTPPTFAIYLMGLTFKWLLANGGLEAVEQRNEEKAAIIYDAIDGSNGYYGAVARKDSRSLMNINFRTPNPDLDKKFIAEALAAGMSGLKGHRSVGGLRASVYNAFPKAGCEALAQFMADFKARNG